MKKFDFDGVRKLVSRATEATRSDVESAIAAAETEITRANAEIARLAPERHAVLINGTDADLQVHDARVSAEMRARDRAAALKEELTGRLAEIAADEYEKTMKRERAEAEKLTDAACAELRKYPALASQIVDILAAVAKADAAVKAVNQKYPDQPRIADAETIVRRDPGQPKEILSEKTVDMWVGPYGAPIDSRSQDKVKPSSKDSEKGTLALPNGQTLDVKKCTFRRVKFLREQNGHTPVRLDTSLVLPGFFGAAGDIYNLYLSSELQTRAPGQEPAAAPMVSRAPEIEFIPVS